VRTSYYYSGRRISLTLGAAAVYALVAFGLWRTQYVLELIAGGLVRAVPVLEMAAMVCAPVAVLGLAARLATTDLVSPRPMSRYAALAATALIVFFASAPVAVLGAVRVFPSLLPPGTFADITTEDRPLAAIYTQDLAVSVAAGSALACALALLTVALAGLAAGPIVYAVLTAAVLVAQSTPEGEVIALSGAGDPPYQLHPWGIILVVAACSSAIAAWAASRSGAVRVASYLSTRPRRTVM
jgi:hypothetical protein